MTSARGLAVVAGFLPDLRAALAANDDVESLGDESPFTEWLDGLDLAALERFAVVAGALEDEASLSEAPTETAGPWLLRRAPAGFVAALGKVDDLRLGTLRDAWFAAENERDGRGPLSEASARAEMADAIRGVVVQCRAAALNNWVVVVANLA